MRKVLVCALAVGLLAAALAGTATAGNTPSGASPFIACPIGSCFVPSFAAAGTTVVYRGPAAHRVDFADCCIAGDTYLVDLSGPTSQARFIFTSFGALNSDCSVGPYLNASTAVLNGGTTNARMTAISLPGGVPASAYIRMSSPGWTQAFGVDSCGF